MEKIGMKKLLIVFVIALAFPVAAQAGRVVPNSTLGEECQCGVPSARPCYEDGTSTVCSLPLGDGLVLEGGGGDTGATFKKGGKANAGTIVMLLLTFGYFLRRFI